jgi:SAM-dependent methyltransferase
VLCQQGLQFFPDRIGALREMHRVLAPGGVVLLGVWAAERPLGLFGPIAEIVAETSAREPYPHAFAPDSYTIDAGSLRELLAAAQFAEVSVELVELECRWGSAEEILATVLATPFGPLVSALDALAQERIREGLRERLGVANDARPTVSTVANVARAVK